MYLSSLRLLSEMKIANDLTATLQSIDLDKMCYCILTKLLRTNSKRETEETNFNGANTSKRVVYLYTCLMLGRVACPESFIGEFIAAYSHPAHVHLKHISLKVSFFEPFPLLPLRR